MNDKVQVMTDCRVVPSTNFAALNFAGMTFHQLCFLAWLLSGLSYCSNQLAAQSADQATNRDVSRGIPATVQDLEKADPGSSELKSRVASLIEQLGDPSFQRRHAAELELTRIGLAAFEQLREARNHPNVQISTAIEYLVRSQNVKWWLESDRLSVRQVLEDYNDLKDSERETAMQSLAKEKSPDALLALCRLARYESSERLSKSAALFLMATLVDKNGVNRESLLHAVREVLDDSDRTACRWLRTLLVGIEQGTSNSDTWKKFTQDEHRLLEQTPSESAKKIVLTLYRWVGTWLTMHDERGLAIAIQRSSLDIIGNRSLHTRDMVMWALESEMPELVEELAARQPEVFATEPELAYLLAESFLKRGDTAKAQATASKASDSIRDKVINALNRQPGIAANASPDNSVSAYREEIAETLIDRGMAAWAEQELTKALTGTLDVRRETRLRLQLSSLYYDAENFSRAAEVLAEFLTGLEKRPAEAEKLKAEFNHGESGDLEYLHSNQKFYAGLAAARSGEKEVARDFFEQAFKHYDGNPDILIELYALDGPNGSNAFYHENVRKMLDQYRTEIMEKEREIANASRLTRATIAFDLAQSCNQLAWLLAKTNQRPQEAIELSERSLELKPNDGIFLDTLARCYFAAGDIEKAIEFQTQALENAPHQLAVARQLAEFKAAAGKN